MSQVDLHMSNLTAYSPLSRQSVAVWLRRIDSLNMYQLDRFGSKHIVPECQKE